MPEPAGAATIAVEVAYAEPARQFLRRVELPQGSSVSDAIAASGVERECAIDAALLTLGIWSKPVKAETRLRDGDRVELYRVLKADPKDSRRRRAERARERRG
jgi:putative ubiquitin-RnfH superfamily antitoxin RatB of RatAB toxin-antitoxin module